MDGMDITPTVERAQIMRRTEMIFSTWAHQMAPEVDWRVALQKDYWSNVAAKLQPGDKIECHSHDHSVAFIIYVIDINVSASPSWWDVAFLPLHPVNLQLPRPEPAVPPRYVVRPRSVPAVPTGYLTRRPGKPFTRTTNPCTPRESLPLK
jgi:hypothetical protein